MTDLVSLLFIATIPTDFKITNFPYTCTNLYGVLMYCGDKIELKDRCNFLSHISQYYASLTTVLTVCTCAGFCPGKP